MSRIHVTVLGMLLLLGACGTQEAPVSRTGVQSLSDVARSLGMTVKPTGFAEDWMLTDASGRSFYVMAGRPIYRFRGEDRPVLGGDIRIARGDLLVPDETVAAMRRDLAGSKPAAYVPKPRSTPKPERPVARPKAPVRRPRRLQGLKVVIDPGHGGRDPGAISEGVSEKMVTLPIARRVIAKLKALGVHVIPTRTGDTYPTLNARADLANRRRADLFVSIHANSAPRKSAAGVEILYRADGNRGRSSRRLATAVVDAIIARTQANNRRARADSRGLRVLKRTRMPAILVEVGFLSNAAERRRLVTSRYQEKVAQGIVDGIVHYVSEGRAALTPVASSRVATRPPRRAAGRRSAAPSR